MKLYRRQLNSVEELRREKLRLEYEKLHTSREDFFPVREHGRPDHKSTSNFMDFLGGLGTSKGPFQMWLTLAKPILRAINKKAKPQKVLGNIAKEVLLGYAKWKVIEMAYRGIRSFIKRQQRKHEARQAADLTGVRP